MNEVDEILAQCTNILPAHRGRISLKEIFQELVEALPEDEYPDMYGAGESLARFEGELAEMLGKEAAVFMPSGTMAQQIALRIWCERNHNFTIAMHPTAHLEFAEHLGYQYLHQIRRIQFGGPEFLRERMLKAEDFENLGQKPGAVLLELPYRELGGQLPTWDELLAIQDWVKSRDIPFHMDGARLWQCRPFYQKSYQEIATLFDSVYVSFYKDLGGLCGSALLGPAEFIQESRVWLRRHGGNLKTQGPFWASARLGLNRVVPQIDRWVERARETAEILSQFDQITIQPNPPHVNFFRLYIRGDAAALTERHMELSKETGTFLFHGLQTAAIPGMAVTELRFEESSLAFDMEQLRPFVERMIFPI
jgi:threonine aldolase